MAQKRAIAPAVFVKTRRSKSNILRKSSGALAACALILAAGLPMKAYADVTDDLLNIMKAKGDLTDAQYKDLKARHEIEKAAYAKKAAPSREKNAVPGNDPVPVAIKKGGGYSDPPPPPPGSTKDGAGAPTYVTALAKGVGVRIGDYEFQTSGDISFFAIEDFPQRRPVIIGGGLLTSGLHNDSFAIRAGLLPSSLQFEVRTNQEGWDIAAHFGMYVGGNSDLFGTGVAPLPSGLGQSDIDFRQVYGTFGTPTIGTVKVGRDIGIFGAEAILYDATIFGAGTPQANYAPGNTTLGRIGIGYVYADWIPQFSYTTPDLNGFTASVGIFTPLNDVNFGGFNPPFTIGFQSIDPNTTTNLIGTATTFPFPNAPESGTLTGKDSPMVQGRLKYVGNLGDSGCGFKDTVCDTGPKLTAWTSALYQNHQVERTDIIFGQPVVGLNGVLGRRAGDSISSWGVDGGAKLDWNGFSILGYAYTGDGLGTTGLFWNAVSANGATRSSSGGDGQASYTFFDRLTLGGSWGISELGFNRTIDDPHLQKDIWSGIGFARYKLTNWVQFQAEYVHTEEENHLPGGRIKDDAVVAGTTFFW